MNTDDDDEHSLPPIPWEALAPLLAWMTSNRVDRLHLVAQTTAPACTVEEPHRDESAYFVHCDEPPAAPGLLDIYTVTDEDGRVGFNGPSPVPPALLHPVLRALDKASVAELSISAFEPDAEAATAGTRTISTFDDVEEYEEPRREDCSPVIIAVRVI
ncbi:MAG: hypothetical protein FJW64_00375 [Actinobacteria bacterium]|nr:hypothetical protein [Actinomycetota bacterium]